MLSSERKEEREKEEKGKERSNLKAKHNLIFYKFHDTDGLF
jgi:hypothetical protein